MNGQRVFIGWSGSDAIAKKVKQELKKEGFDGVVGGETVQKSGLYIGQVVLNEIDECNQAIYIMEKKEFGDVEIISNNIMFEFGYALSKYDRPNVHIYYINIDRTDEAIPTDITGIMATHFYLVDSYSSEQLQEKIKKFNLSREKNIFNTTDEIVKQIVEEFVKNQSAGIALKDKMEVIDSYFSLRSQIKEYNKRHFCSKYELPWYILFFAQAIYIFEDIEEGDLCLREFSNSIRGTSDILLQTSLSSAATYLAIFGAATQGDEGLYLDKTNYIKRKNDLIYCCNAARKLEDCPFKTWLQILLFDSQNLIRLLYLACPETKIDHAIIEESIRWAEKCLEQCTALTDDCDASLVQIYKAYMNRNLSIAYSLLIENNDLQSDSNEWKQKRDMYLIKSHELRQDLWIRYRNSSIDTIIRGKLEMEYYLSASEMVKHKINSEQIEDQIEDCTDYISQWRSNKEKTSRIRSHFVQVIENNIRL